MFSIQGKPVGSFDSFIGIVTLRGVPIFSRKNYIFVNENISFNALGYIGVLSSNKILDRFYIPNGVCEVANINSLKEGDIVEVDSSGKIFVLWAKNSHQNVLLLTEACNCNCMMCPQPPKKNDPVLAEKVEKILDLLEGRDISDICISGGEPSVIKEKFLYILKRCVCEHPEAQINILTNAKLFSDENYVDKVSAIATKNVIFCVSLHSDISEIHDAIVGAKGSYIKTVNGIYNLAQNGCCIEIRIVINKYNYLSLERFAEHLSNYLPFCIHYAFMGMEIHGLAIKNFDKINVYPYEYQSQLKEAILLMHRRGLWVSVYNIPLCMCSKDIWPFAERSISDWKNIYHKKCVYCSVREKCCGFFSTSLSLPIKFITPI